MRTPSVEPQTNQVDNRGGIPTSPPPPGVFGDNDESEVSGDEDDGRPIFQPGRLDPLRNDDWSGGHSGPNYAARSDFWVLDKGSPFEGM